MQSVVMSVDTNLSWILSRYKSLNFIIIYILKINIKRFKPLTLIT